MNKLFFVVISIISLASLASCDPGSKRFENYYYSEEGLDSYKSDSDTIINLKSDQNILDFIKGKEFVSKGSKISFDDSLHVTIYYNGKKEAVYDYEIQQYICKEERNLFLSHSKDSTHLRFTVVSNGMIADMKTYALYKARN